MALTSAGLLMYKVVDTGVAVLLGHPGGPFWRAKDVGAWTIPKGEVEEGEDLFNAACREFQEETGLNVSDGMIPLGALKQRGGKLIHAWAFKGDCDATKIKSSSFKLEWPPKSGKLQEFPEIDRAQFWDIADAAVKINPGQVGFLVALCLALGQDFQELKRRVQSGGEAPPSTLFDM